MTDSISIVGFNTSKHYTKNRVTSNRVEVSYKLTTGYFSIGCENGDIRELQDEKSLYTLKQDEQNLVKELTLIVYATIHRGEL